MYVVVKTAGIETNVINFQHICRKDYGNYPYDLAAYAQL